MQCLKSNGSIRQTDGILVVDTTQHTIYRVDLQKSSFFTYKDTKPRPYSVMEGKDGVVWLYNGDTIIRFDVINNKVK